MQIEREIERPAELAMKAAKSVARARKRSQKEKRGHEVCQYLLCLLNDESQGPTRLKMPAIETLKQARSVDMIGDPQISLGF
ncbi:MAG: hypothetical protein WD558_02675 [Pseudomonadales bacterium]